MKKLALGFLGISFLFFLMICVSILKAYIMKDISILFEIPFLQELKLMHFFGINFIVALAVSTINKKKENNNDDPMSKITLILTLNMNHTFGIILLWGLAYISHYIFF